MKNLIASIVALLLLGGVGHSQSILTDQPETAAQRAARETIVALQGAKSAILGIVRDGVGRTFGPGDHQAVMDNLGARAGKAVTYYETLIVATMSILEMDGDAGGIAELQAIISVVPAYSKNADGTVTILPEPEPTPEQEPLPEQ